MSLIKSNTKNVVIVGLYSIIGREILSILLRNQ